MDLKYVEGKGRVLFCGVFETFRDGTKENREICKSE
jgi:hypothetical protein